MVKTVSTSDANVVTSRFAVVDDKRKRYELLMPRYSELLQDSGIRIVKVNQALRDYGILVFKASSYGDRDKLYDNCCVFLDKFEELRTLLSHIDDVYNQTVNMIEELSNSSVTLQKYDLKDDQPFKEINNADIAKNIRKFVSAKVTIEYIIRRLWKKGLGDLRLDSPGIDGNTSTIDEILLKLIDYCEARSKICALIQATCEEVDIKEEDIMDNLLRSTTEHKSDTFG